MSLLSCHFFSETLQKHVQMKVILPEKGAGPFPVYYLLHGLSDDCHAWTRRSSIERYAENFPFAIVMPDGFRSFYTDNAEGPAYGRYILDDVLGFVERTFPVQRERTGRCIGGLSMGGYGALRLALSRPDLFISANSHSGALEAGRGVREQESFGEFLRVFGKTPLGSQHDLQALALSAQSKSALPHIRIDCGTEDYLLDHNRAFHTFAQKNKIPHEYEEFPGAHTWEYWDRHVQEALSFHAKHVTR